MVSLGEYRSRVTGPRDGEKGSFRTTIPKPVAKALGLKHKDVIVWELRVEDDQVIAVVRKAPPG